MSISDLVFVRRPRTPSSWGEALRHHVVQWARPGDLDDTIRAVEGFGPHDSIDVARADELEEAVRRTRPGLVLQLGASYGYPALRAARALPEDACIGVLEPRSDRADIARTIWRHAGITGRVHVVVGCLRDGWTAQALPLRPGAVDVMFVGDDLLADDVQHAANRAWLHDESVVITGAVA